MSNSITGVVYIENIPKKITYKNLIKFLEKFGRVNRTFFSKDLSIEYKIIGWIEYSKKCSAKKVSLKKVRDIWDKHITFNENFKIFYLKSINWKSLTFVRKSIYKFDKKCPNI
ncbi:hypothetical protein (nucleomorph) [Guillardia theta]|uniref:RRM domain-containing protein n=1 Tax=Guillardia theta TaxID=55529 RepID=Q98S87_GUITH|nr:hypothetical protein GTHECHR3051 [Guillardia theta]AAK39695.1 hypothetical protein [Guillardia theta]